MMAIIGVSLVVVYLLIAAYCFTNWLKWSVSDVSSSLKEHCLILINLAIAVLLWPIVVPIVDVHFFE
ncbi:MAG TPA: hypothetical protein DCE56_30450 [Cyanobacteria bacterium UBA8553]|nr:hypothetical protein [Cyanobacteria bacterium UBA8553]